MSAHHQAMCCTETKAASYKNKRHNVMSHAPRRKPEISHCAHIMPSALSLVSALECCVCEFLAHCLASHTGTLMVQLTAERV